MGTGVGLGVGAGVADGAGVAHAATTSARPRARMAAAEFAVANERAEAAPRPPLRSRTSGNPNPPVRSPARRPRDDAHDTVPVKPVRASGRASRPARAGSASRGRSHAATDSHEERRHAVRVWEGAHGLGPIRTPQGSVEFVSTEPRLVVDPARQPPSLPGRSVPRRSRQRCRRQLIGRSRPRLPVSPAGRTSHPGPATTPTHRPPRRHGRARRCRGACPRRSPRP